MSYLIDRKEIFEKITDDSLEEAARQIRGYIDREPPYSGDRWHAMHDHFTVSRLIGEVPEETASLFSPDYIGRFNLAEILQRDISDINARLESQLLEHGYRENPRDWAGISGHEKLIINDARFLLDRQPFAGVWRVIEKVADQYFAEMRKFDALAPFMEPSYGHRLFASATRGDGYHQSHIHSKASFVMVYYVRVFDEGPATLQFGTHTSFNVPPFAKCDPVEGDMIIFPAFFAHSSTPTKYEGLRATIGVEFEPESLSQAAPTC